MQLAIHPRTIAFLLLLAAPAAAQGGPPLRTDDPVTPGDGRWEIDFATTLLDANDLRIVERPLIDVNYGLGANVQLKYEIPYVWEDPNGDARAGLGNSLFGVKWRFRDALDASPAMSIYPQLEFENPWSSSVDRGLAEEGPALLLPFEIAWDLGQDGVNAEIGRELRNGSSGGWIAGLAFSRAYTPEVELLAEVYGVASSDLDTSNGTLDAGARIDLAEGCTLLMSFGIGLWSHDEEPPDFLSYLGVQLRF